ncbi:antibiotic biosynthesis monooxygenase [Streptomyces sp. NPDC018347]|uniref:antibiotic biosynthesis monooxygenase family protein n=1 Tax=Streptomyces sp. NPDC018347 TaxID=3157193 RepID=UPI0033E76EEE
MLVLDPDGAPAVALDRLTLAERDWTGQEKLLGLLGHSHDTTAHPGRHSATLHAAHTRAGVAAPTRWRTVADLRAHHAGDAHQRELLQLGGLAGRHRVLAAEPVSVQRAPSVTGPVDVTAERDDWTSIAIQWVAPADQDALVAELTRPREEWVHLLPGHRSHSVLRGLDGTFVVNYAQWESEEAYRAFHHVPEERWPEDVRASRDRARKLTRDREYNTFRVVRSHTAA